MSQTPRKTPNARRMLMRMSAQLRATFSPVQITAIEAALVPRTHLVDVRLLLPLLGKGAYCVFAAGPNRRAADRPSSSTLQNRSPADISKVFSNVIALSQLPHQSPNAYRMLQRMPADVSTTFSAAQIQAIENALVPRKHMVDLRLSLPFLGKGAYLAFAAGPNKRAHYRNLQNGNPFVMPAVGASVLVGAAVIIGLVHLRGSSLLRAADPAFAKESFNPTVVPFKKNRKECVESNRQWVDDQCIDKSHDPTF